MRMPQAPKVEPRASAAIGVKCGRIGRFGLSESHRLSAVFLSIGLVSCCHLWDVESDMVEEWHRGIAESPKNAPNALTIEHPLDSVPLELWVLSPATLFLFINYHLS